MAESKADTLWAEKEDSICYGLSQIFPQKSAEEFRRHLREGREKTYTNKKGETFVGSRHWPIWSKRVSYSVYAEVKELTGEIIASNKFELYNAFYNLFKIPGKMCNESLFECQCTDFGNGSGDMVDADQWFVFQGPANNGNISSGTDIV